MRYEDVEYHVTSIGDSAFFSCRAWFSVNIPQSVTSIGNAAFFNCYGLQSVDIPQSVTSIGNAAFFYCPGLQSVDIPSGITSIGDSTFFNCSGLQSVNIPEGVVSVGKYAFALCHHLSILDIPSTLTSIGEDAFRVCPIITLVNRSQLNIEKGSSAYGIQENYPIRIIKGNGLEWYGDFLFKTQNGAHSLMVCKSFADIISLPAGYKNAGYSIADSAFYRYDYISKMIIPFGVTAIGKDAFRDCRISIIENYSQFSFEKGSADDGMIAYGADKVINVNEYNRDGDFLFKTVDGKHFLMGYLGDEDSLVLPKTYNNEAYGIGDMAFFACDNLVSVNIPSGVTSIGDSAFVFCYGLTEIDIPEGVTSMLVTPFGMLTDFMFSHQEKV